jgi:hypothetical protein
LKVLGTTDTTLDDEDWELLKKAGLLGWTHRPFDADGLAQAVSGALDMG